jgi:hypothetical protein
MRNSRGYADGSSFRPAAAASQVVAGVASVHPRGFSIDASCRWSAATGNRHTTTKTVQGRRANRTRRPANPLVVRLPELEICHPVWGLAHGLSVGDQVLLTALRTRAAHVVPFGPIRLRTGTMRVCSPDVSAQKACAWQLQTQTRSAVFNGVLQNLVTPDAQCVQVLWIENGNCDGSALPQIGDGADQGTEYLAR